MARSWQSDFQDGKVIFIRHGSVYVRASVNKVLRRGSEISQNQSLGQSIRAVDDSANKDSNDTVRDNMIEEELGNIDSRQVNSSKTQDNERNQVAGDHHSEEIQYVETEHPSDNENGDIIKLNKNDKIQVKLIQRKICFKFENWSNSK